MENELIYNNIKKLCRNNEDTIEVLIACIKILYNISYQNSNDETAYILSRIYANVYLNELNFSNIKVTYREDGST